MPKFDKRFVYCVWYDEMEGQKVFVSDFIDELEIHVKSNDVTRMRKVKYAGGKRKPFYEAEIDQCWQFVYFDPNYETKLAYEQGKKIQAFVDNRWKTFSKEVDWEKFEKYRVKPKGSQCYE